MKSSTHTGGARHRRHPLLPVAAACILASGHALAVEIETGNPDWNVRFDNTVKLGAIYRVKNADPALVDSFAGSGAPIALNLNAGDDNFRNSGLVSRRLDLLSEFDAIYQKDFGVRLSGAAWYDDAYHGSTHAADPANGQQPYNEFTRYTKNNAGQKAELLDAFVFAGWRLDGGQKATVRLGRHALQWGESLFFGDNAIARAQGPIDIFKLLASPNAQFKEIIRPVPQISGQLQVSSNLSVGAYYQFGWEEDRLPPAGSYFSSSNLPWGGSPIPQFAVFPGIGALQIASTADRKPSRNGQFGLQLKWRVDETDLGFYAVRFHDKDGQLYTQLTPGAVPDASGFIPASRYYVFPKSVNAVGASASRSWGDFNVALEASIRDNMPLRNTQMFYGFFPGQPAPTPATGRTAHLNASWLGTFGPNFLANESSVLGEIAWNRVLSRKDPDQMLDAGRTRDASALQIIYTPTYRQAFAGVDLNVPLGIRYTLSGRSSVTAWDAKGVGTATVGLEANYLGVWQIALAYSHYIGKATPFIDYTPEVGANPGYGWGNALADRNNVSFSLRRTF